ncbi:MAG: pilus assembly PilX N-terminal domain-containing protein [Rhizobacter sp.]|nr:pilus assembly PilX N-terminal domain-containing protein [Rhizobacter sp.]
MRRTAAHTARHQRGAAALIVTMVLFFAMLLASAYANRSLLFDQRGAANQYRSTQAFEAAEAGLEWAVAQINSNRRIGPDCTASSDPTAHSFRQRYLSRLPGAGGFTGNTWSGISGANPLQPACVRSDAGWSCSCPSNGHPGLAAPTGAGPSPAFALQFLPGDKPGVVRVVASGCSSLGGPCMPGGSTSTDAVARVEVALAMLPALFNPPLAPLTLRGAVETGAALGTHNPDPASGGMAVQAGAQILAPQIRVSVPAGAPMAGALVGNDAGLASTGPAQFFELYFGLGKDQWRSLPGVQQVACGGSCGTALASTVAAGSGDALLWVGGDALIEGPITLGSAQQPIILAVGGTLRFSGAVRLHGVVYATSAQWDNTPPGSALLRGALISETGYWGSGAPDLFYDAALLDALKSGSGSFARVSGSWRDF